jgi:hypothetical protein
MPEVDFRRYDVIVASLGVLPDVSAAIEVRRTDVGPYARIIGTAIQFAAAGCIVANAQHSPAVFVRVPTVSQPTLFVDEVRIVECR